MALMIRCPACKGQKKIIMMGGLQDKMCDVCKGVGYIEKDKAPKPVIIVKKGRKKKEINSDEI